MLNYLFKYLLLKQNIYLSDDELNSLRFILLKKQLLHVYHKIPYYKAAFDKAGLNPASLKSIEDLSTYPIITKDIIRANNLEFLNSPGFKSIFKSHTSGSTGQPMWTYYDFKSWIRKKYLVKARTRLECGVKPYDKILIFESASQNSLEKRNFLFRTFKSHYKTFSIFESNEEIVKKLIAFSPSVLYGSPSYFFQLAQYISTNNLNLPFIKRIFTSSEYLQDNVREYIKKIFNAEIYDIYGSTEFKEVAWECEKHEGYHINEDEVIMEILKDGKTVEPGIVGNIAITDLRNTKMPLIRYQMHDKGMLICEKCSCGRTFSLMKPYAGRSSEYIILPDGETLSPYLFTTSIEKIKGLQQYQVIQVNKNKILVYIVAGSEHFRSISESVKNILSRITHNVIEIEIEQRMNIDTEENSKFKLVKNLVLEQKKI
jgi:phenylacetate-coenzyme A ligase PaaK-like adenylate-forming protein